MTKYVLFVEVDHEAELQAYAEDLAVPSHVQALVAALQSELDYEGVAATVTAGEWCAVSQD